jgi:hypothetical protein
VIDDTWDLFIWSGGEPTDLSKVRAAKAELESDEFNPWATPLPKVRPVNCGPQGLPDTTLDARVLAIGSPPPFICHYFLVGEDAGQEEFTRAMTWVLGLVEEDERANMVIDTMRRVFGPETREISEEEQEATKRFRDYQRNLA